MEARTLVQMFRHILQTKRESGITTIIAQLIQMISFLCFRIVDNYGKDQTRLVSREENSDISHEMLDIDDQTTETTA